MSDPSLLNLTAGTVALTIQKLFEGGVSVGEIYELWSQIIQWVSSVEKLGSNY